MTCWRPPLPWILIAVVLGGAFVVLVLVAIVLWRQLGRNPRVRDTGKRLGKLSTRRKLRLAWALARDRRIRRPVRAIPFFLLLYLAMPLDIVPDFIPVVGQLDDLLVLAIGAGLMIRFTPADVLEEHLRRLEQEQAERATSEGDPPAGA